MHSFRVIALLLVLGAAPLAAQSVPTISAHPPLPLGLEWEMTEPEVLAVLKKVGVTMELVEEGESYTGLEARRMAAEYNVSVQEMRDQKTWHRYVARNVEGYADLPPGNLSIVFYRKHPRRARFAIPTESSEQYLAITDTLTGRYSTLYGVKSAEGWDELPRFSDGKVIVFAEIAQFDQSRPDVFRGWNGVVGKTMYGTRIYNDPDARLVVDQMVGPAPTARRGR